MIINKILEFTSNLELGFQFETNESKETEQALTMGLGQQVQQPQRRLELLRETEGVCPAGWINWVMGEGLRVGKDTQRRKAARERGTEAGVR